MKILHRAKEINTGEWKYGFFTGTPDFLNIKENGEPEIVKIDIETVGVFIGKYCTETKKPLFTGDIIEDIVRHEKYFIAYDDFAVAFRLRSSQVLNGMRNFTSGRLTGNIFDDWFDEPEDREREQPDKTRSSEAFTRRNQKNALKQTGVK